MSEDNASMTLQGLIDESHGTAVEKGWWDNPDRSFGEIVALFHTEVSEAFEEYRAGHALDEIYYGESGKPEGVPIELADLLIRIADFAGHYGVPLEDALRLKLAYNRTRPYRHGGKRA